MGGDSQDVIARANLVLVLLTNAQFSRSPNLPPDGGRGPRYWHDQLVDLPTFDPESSMLSAQVSCRVWINPEDTEPSNNEPEDNFDAADLMVEATYLVVFELDAGAAPAPDATGHFMETIGRMTVWPYFRSHFASVTGDAGLVLPPLPLKKARYAIAANAYRQAEPAEENSDS